MRTIMVINQLTNMYDNLCGTKDYEGNNRSQIGNYF